jgi:hypothetical protein
MRTIPLVANANLRSARVGAVSPPDNSVPINGLLVGSTAILASLICYVAVDSRPAIALAILIIGAPGMIAASRFQRFGLIDGLGLFCLAFLAYNGVILLRLATMPETTAVPYPWSFTQNDYERAGLLSVIAAISICVTSLLVAAIWKPRGKISRRNDSRPRHIAWLPTGVLMYAVGLAMYFQQWQQAGGYLAGLKAGRGIRFEVFGSTGLSWPYTAFAIPGLAALWCAAEQQRTAAARWIAWIALITWCALLLPQGDRLYVVEALITTLAVHYTCRRRPLTLTPSLGIALVLLYFLSAMFGQIRGLVAPLAGGEMTWNEAQAVVNSAAKLDWMKLERSELAGPYFSLLQVSAIPSEGLLEGENSQLDALLAILPKALYPGQKPSQLSHRFDDSVDGRIGPTPGWGFSAVAEAYLNLGYGGVALMFMLWTLVFYGLDALKQLPRVGPVLFSVLLPEVINANRMDFRNVYGEAGYYLGGVMLAFLLTQLHGIFLRKPADKSTLNL